MGGEFPRPAAPRLVAQAFMEAEGGRCGHRPPGVRTAC